MLNVIIQVREDLYNQLLRIKAEPQSDVFSILPVLQNLMPEQLETWVVEGFGVNTFIVMDLLLTKEQFQQLLNLPAAHVRIRVLRVLLQDGTDLLDNFGNIKYPYTRTRVHGKRTIHDRDGNVIGTTDMSFIDHPNGWDGLEHNRRFKWL